MKEVGACVHLNLTITLLIRVGGVEFGRLVRHVFCEEHLEPTFWGSGTVLDTVVSKEKYKVQTTSKSQCQNEEHGIGRVY
jgi:hypothetical protein